MYRIEWKKEIPAFLLILLMFAAGVYLYPGLPDRIPMHWNIRGEIDSWAPKGPFSVFMLPGMTLAIFFLLLYTPFIDPKKDRYAQFAGPYRLIRYGFIVFMGLIYALTLSAAAGETALRVEKLVPGALGGLFILIGGVLPRVRTNWFVGIRTPWTMENEGVWTATHRLAARTFSAAGAVMILSTLLPAAWSFGITIGSAVAAAITPVVYSWILYRRSDRT